MRSIVNGWVRRSDSNKEAVRKSARTFLASL